MTDFKMCIILIISVFPLLGGQRELSLCRDLHIALAEVVTQMLFLAFHSAARLGASVRGFCSLCAEKHCLYAFKAGKLMHCGFCSV